MGWGVRVVLATRELVRRVAIAPQRVKIELGKNWRVASRT